MSGWLPILTTMNLALHTRFPDTITALHAIIRHPRSLARPLATWRPPTRKLPPVSGLEKLTVAITRRRVGPQAKARIRKYGQQRIPAYLIELRITDEHNALLDRTLTQAWVRTLVPDQLIGAVHELSTGSAMTYMWLVDGTFHPVFSPASMFHVAATTTPGATAA